MIFSANQALLAARAGATFVSPFVGRIDDMSMDGITLIEDIAEIFIMHDIKAEIIAASVRTPMHIDAVCESGRSYCHGAIQGVNCLDETSFNG